jgi:Zn finger protein HypA/HybF involved in hydrogenase expression
MTMTEETIYCKVCKKEYKAQKFDPWCPTCETWDDYNNGDSDSVRKE